MYQSQINKLHKELTALQAKQNVDTRNNALVQYSAMAISSLFVMNIAPLFGLGIIALIAHFFLLIAMGKLLEQTWTVLQLFGYPLLAISWAWFLLSAMWTMTIGLIF